VDYYKLAEEEFTAIAALYNAGQYRHAVTHSCMAIEYLLKTKLVQIDPTSEYLYGHDIINIFKIVQEKYESSRDLRSIVRFCRKYHNESRYPTTGTAAFTKEFAEQFEKYVEDTKYYIDNECLATLEDLANRFKSD
jgi:HEPN domain-containing protein